MPIATDGRATAPSESWSRQAKKRSIGGVAHADGRTKAPTSPWASVKATSDSTSARSPAADRNAFRTMRTSSRSESPTGRASFKGLHQEGFDRQHDGGEAQRIGENTCHIEQLERNTDLEPDPVRPAQQLHDQHDLPHQRQAGARRPRQGGPELWQHHAAK